MALHPRKFLVAETEHDDPEYDEKYANLYCFCDQCTEEGCRFPPPEPLPPPPSGSPAHQMSTVLIVMLGVLAVALLFLFYFTIYGFRNSRRRSSAALESGDGFIDENQGPVVDHHIWYIRTSGLSQSAIDSISVFKYKRGDGLIEGSDCAVCLSEFQEEESLRLLPKCGHAFHLPCIDTWLRSHKNCPVCRAPILISNGNSIPSDSAEQRRSNLGSREENLVQNGSEREVEMERDESRETRVRPGNSTPMPIQEDMLLKIRCGLDARNGNLRVLSDLADHRVKTKQKLQPARRSVSIDLSMIHQAAANGCAGKDEGCSDAQLEIVEEQNSEMAGKRGGKNSSLYRLIKSASYGKALQKGPVSMKRSFSFSGKRSQRKSNSRSQESISTPEMISMR